jgi:hypothetical protein
MTKNLTLFIILNLVCLNSIFSTEQTPDYLIYKNDTLRIYSNPLGEKVEQLFKDKKFTKQRCLSTACWRGYRATWKIEDGKLYLLKIADCCNSEIRADLKLIFGNELINNKVLANWYSGEIIIPVGKNIYGEHMGYSNVHEFEDILEIKEGEILKTNRVDNRKTSLEYLNSDKLTIHLIKELDKKILNKIWENEFELDFYVDIVSNEKRQILKVSFEQISDIEFENEIKKAILKIKDWDILYKHGEKVDLPWLYPVRINKKKLRKNKKYWW